MAPILKISALSVKDRDGFTLIELMVVISILGILAAIAIPNYISYRNNGFCSKAEADANYMASEISEYYAIPTRTECVTPEDMKVDGITPNPVDIFCSDDNPNLNVTIVVTDSSGRCPADYQFALTASQNPTGYWDGSQHFIKIID